VLNSAIYNIWIENQLNRRRFYQMPAIKAIFMEGCYTKI